MWNQNITGAASGSNQTGDLTITYDSNTGLITFNGSTGSMGYINPFTSYYGSLGGCISGTTVGKYYLYVEIINNPDNLDLNIFSLNSRIQFSYEQTKGNFMHTYRAIGVLTQSNSSRGGGFGLASFGGPNTIFNNVQMKVMLINLTKIYGLDNEPTTAEQFEEDYFKWFGHAIGWEPPVKETIRDTKINVLKTIGFNQYDENFTLGSTQWGAQPQPQHYIPIIRNNDYYIHVGSFTNSQSGGGGWRNIIAYDYKFNSIQNGYTWLSDQNGFKPQFNVTYIKFSLSTNYGTQNKNDICVNIYNSDVNKTYQPYEDRTYSIPITSITGKLNGTGNSVVVFPDGMKSAGSACDEIINDGGLTKAIKRVYTIDLGTLNWSYAAPSNVNSWANGFYAALPVRAKAIGRGNTWTTFTNTRQYKPCGGFGSGYVANKSLNTENGNGWLLQIGDNDLTQSDIVNNKISKFNGFLLNYELETPQVYILDNFNLPINVKVWKSGTERYESYETNGTSPKLTIHYNIS